MAEPGHGAQSSSSVSLTTCLMRCGGTSGCAGSQNRSPVMMASPPQSVLVPVTVALPPATEIVPASYQVGRVMIYLMKLAGLVTARSDLEIHLVLGGVIDRIALPDSAGAVGGVTPRRALVGREIETLGIEQ